MGAFLDKPKMEKQNARGDGNGLRYGLSSMQGWRVEMEDAHTAVIGLPHGLSPWSFFAVYDGHAGSQVARYCCEHLLEHITSNPDFQGTAELPPEPQPQQQSDNASSGEPSKEEQEQEQEEEASAGEAGDVPSVDQVKMGIRTGFLQIDEHMRQISENRKGGGGATDRSGSTAVCAMVSPTHVYFINCGDSRGLLSRAGDVHFFTQDHKPSNPAEKERIQNAGGSVMIQRVNGSLAVSRALGDFDYKCVHGKGPTEQLVSPEPEVCAIERSVPHDEFIVLACDGIWDVMANEELCNFVRSRLEVTDDLERVCNEIVDTCLYKGSRDNMSVVLVTFEGAPKVTAEAVKREQELDKYLESRVEEILKQNGEEGVPDMVHVMRTLASENIPNLPPGGELASKRSVIEAVYNKLNPFRNEDTDPDILFFRGFS
ncbi:protein phosphatase 1A isoform X2 [Engraulis encrasicolus]|uniref:protein phosphatase 1A isoform X2 n=1 Tax=Engraulis encrasicolus TaxID=184585 RepID=UPI002FD21A64